MRTIKIYSTSLGNASKEINTEVTSFGELQNVLRDNDIDFSTSSMKAIVGETRVTLESREAVLPTGNFSLFLLPRKTKSGKITIYDEYERLSDLNKRKLELALHWGSVEDILEKCDIDYDEEDLEGEDTLENVNPAMRSLMDDEDLCC